jgi:hypothetical protein
MSWGFSPLLPASAHQQSNPFAKSADEAATASETSGATVATTIFASSIEYSGVAGVGYGYFCGGTNNGSNASTAVDRINYQTKAIAASANALNVPTRNASGIQSRTHGYVTVHDGDCEKLTFSNETVASGFSQNSRLYGASASCESHGYWIGGPVGLSRVLTKMPWATEVNTDLSSSMSQLRYCGAGACQNNLFVAGGYEPGGGTYPYFIYKYDLATDSELSMSSYLNTYGRSESASMAFTTCLYFYGGYNSGNGFLTDVEKLVEATEAVTTLSLTLSVSRQSPGVANGVHAGYVAGGNVSAVPVSSTEEFVQSSESRTALGATIGAAVYGIAGLSTQYFSSSAISTHDAKPWVRVDVPEIAAWPKGAGYVVCGREPDDGGYETRVNTVDKLSFSTETISILAATCSEQRWAGPAGVTSDRKGFFAGGRLLTPTTSIDAMAYAVETIAAITATLSYARVYSGTISAPNSAGYIVGGRSGGAGYGDIEKLAFTAETVSTLSATVQYLYQYGIGACNGINGYLFTGYNDINGASSALEVLRLSDETRLSVTTSGSALGVHMSSGAQSTADLYTFGGFTGAAVSNGCNKANLASYTLSVVSIALATSRYHSAGVGHSGAGYTAGGVNSSGTFIDSIERLAYNTETYSTLAAVLTATRTQSGNVSTPIGVADNPSATNTVGGQQDVAIVQSASAAESIIPLVSYTIESIEATASTDTPLAGATFPIGSTEPAAATDLAAGVRLAICAALDALAATSAENLLLTRNVSRAEPLSSVDGSSTEFTLSAGSADALTLTDTQSGGTAFGGALSETASPVDSALGAVAFGVAGSAVAASTDTAATTAAILATSADILVLVEAESATALFVSSRSEPASAAHTNGAAAQLVSSGMEPAFAADAQGAARTQNAARAEGASAVDTPSVAVTLLGTLTDAATATDVISSTSGTLHSSSAGESAASADAQTVTSAFVASAAEAATVSAAQNASALLYAIRSDVLTAAHMQGAQALVVAVAGDGASASSIQVPSTVWAVNSSALAAAIADQSGASSLSAAIFEALNAIFSASAGVSAFVRPKRFIVYVLTGREVQRVEFSPATAFAVTGSEKSAPATGRDTAAAKTAKPTAAPQHRRNTVHGEGENE